MEEHSKRQSRPSFEAARAARLAAVQALFQIHHTPQPILEVIQEFQIHRFAQNEYPHEPDAPLFKALVLKACEREEDTIRLIDANLSESWTYLTLEPVLREILKAGVVELLDPVVQLPAPVIISEYIDLTRGFMGPTEATLTNAVLDGVAKSLGLALKKK